MSQYAEAQEEIELEHHPEPGQYVKIAVILAILTAMEVAVAYLDALSDVIIPVLGALAIAKFAMVVGYFMHLKFDSKLFRYLFVTGLVFAIALFSIVLTIFFGSLGGPAPGGPGG
ncbi:MAG: cytochrome C oxidase subunit IV [Actinobacteria bacterium]|nr:cytochrome C oxidase subunit IV [Actinomycetota bacterium]